MSNDRTPDIPGEGIPVKLPAHLRELLEDIHRRAGRQLQFQKVPQLPGGSVARSELRGSLPVIEVTTDHPPEAVLAEELLHLKRRLAGYPTLIYTVGMPYEGSLTILFNLVEHQAIYPVLEGWGYHPRESENLFLSRVIPFFESGRHRKEVATQSRICLYAVNFARAMVLATDEVLKERLRACFAGPDLSQARAMGDALIAILSEEREETPAAMKSLLEACLHEILKIPRHLLQVLSLAHPT